MQQNLIHSLSDVKSNKVGTGTRIWQYVIVMAGAQIGKGCNICSHCLIENDVIIGDFVTVKSGVQLWDGLRVEDYVFIGPNVTFTNDKYPKSGNTNFLQRSTRIEAGAIVGGGAVILPGVLIGARAIIGAGSVVTKDVLPGTTVVGNPAKVLHSINH